MSRSKQFAASFAGAVMVMTLAGASAFADSRPSNETRRRSGESAAIRRDRSASSESAARRDESRNEPRAESRERARVEPRVEPRVEQRRQERVETRTEARSEVRVDGRREGRGRDERGNDTWRNDSRSSRSGNGRTYGNNGRGNGNGRSYGNRQPYYANGRVSRVHPYRGGYQVWVGGAPYPFFIPASHYHRDRFRVGVTIHLGGYYNPGGYYDYYDGAYSRGDLRGTVESVDYRRDTFVIRNDATGNFVTVELRDRREDVRPGDYVELSGEWSRAGFFRAYDVDLLDTYRR